MLINCTLYTYIDDTYLRLPESLLEAYESYDPVIVQGCPISSLNIAEASIWLLYHFPMTTNDVKLLEVTLDGGGGELGSDCGELKARPEPKRLSISGCVCNLTIYL